MTDRTKEHRIQDIIPCQPADLSSLQSLRLCGWPALTFDPAAFGSTRSLVSLEMSINRRDDQDRISTGFIPPLEELNRSYGVADDAVDKEDTPVGAFWPSIVRPFWSWDWDLLNLTSLILTSEFALRFKFRMLQRTPVLENLTLDIRSSGQVVHTRTLSEADLFVSASSATTAQYDSSTSNLSTLSTQSSTLARIVLPKLKVLKLHGKWIMANDLRLSQFVHSIFPNVYQIEMESWAYSTLRALILRIKANTLAKPQGILTLRRCCRITISPMSQEQLADLGMILADTFMRDYMPETEEEEQYWDDGVGVYDTPVGLAIADRSAGYYENYVFLCNPLPQETAYVWDY
jgi:hypothetical protein